MPTIHLPGDGHATPVPDPDGTKWDPYSDAKVLATLKAALHILKHNIRGMRPCHDCFKRLPGGAPSRKFSMTRQCSSVSTHRGRTAVQPTVWAAKKLRSR
jgi:hypothetical protein